MPKPERARLPHNLPSWVPDGCMFFITINCVPRGRDQLTQTVVAHTILDAAEYQHANHIWFCRLLLLMPDHLHAVLAFGPEPGMKTVVTNWKRYLARHSGIEWQRDFFDHRLRNRQEEEAKINYILQNPVRRGLVSQQVDWPWVYRPNDRLPPC